MKNKSGITLIALIITIIVMLILVAVSVQILIKSDLIGTAESAAEKYRIAAEKEQNLNEITIDGKTYESVEEYIEELEKDNNLLGNERIIPNGGIYKKYIGDGKSFEDKDFEVIEGNGINQFPETTNYCDRYIFGNFEYCYGLAWCECNDWSNSADSYENEYSGVHSCDSTLRDLNGWGVRCIDDVSEPTEILEKINGKNVTMMCYAFAGNTTITTIKNIPNNVTYLWYAFEGCTSLLNLPKIPNSVTNMCNTFEDCTSLAIAPEIPSSVRNMYNLFKGCTFLTGTITINANPINYFSCFENVDFAAQEITLTGSSTILDEIGATGLNYCTTCNGACAGNH